MVNRAETRRPRPLTARGRFPLARLLLGVAGLAFPCAAQSDDPAPELVTDRPDQTESSAVVPRGFVQVETGFLFTREDAGGLRTQTWEVLGTLTRIGLADWAELRLGWAGAVNEDVSLGPLSADKTGVGDAEIGAKLWFRSERGPLPEAALVVGFSLPAGEDDFSSERVDPAFRFSLSHTLSQRLSLGYNAGMFWESGLDATGNRATLSRYLYTLALGIGLTDRWSSFVEVFGDLAASQDGRPAHSFDGGFTFLVTPNVQLDVSSGVGLSAAAPDWFLGAGVSFRLPR